MGHINLEETGNYVPWLKRRYFKNSSKVAEKLPIIA